MDFKNTLRKELNHKLSLLTEKELIKRSKSLSNNLTESQLWKGADEVFLYINFKKEVITKDIIEQGKKDKKRIYAPLITGKKMSFHRIDNLKEEALVKNKYGILEPPTGLEDKVPDSNTLMIIPGVGFTKDGKRLGRGGGFYDRYLSQYPDIIKVAIALELQICETIPTEEWDKKVDYLITEENIYKTGGL